MTTPFKKLAAGIATAALALGGLALGVSSAYAANGAGTITINNPNDDAAAHKYTAYLVAPYNDDYKASTREGYTDYVNIDTFGYGTVPQAGVVAKALQTAGVTTTANTDTVSKDLEKLTTTSAESPWGYIAGTNAATAAERKFADALAEGQTFISGVTNPITLTAGAEVNPAGLYLVLDTLTSTNSVNPASTQSVPMLVPSTIGNYKGLIGAEGNPTTIDGIIDLKNTVVPVTKQVIETGGTTPR